MSSKTNMLDIKYIREHVDEVKKGTADKQYDPSVVDKVLEVDEKRREVLREVEDLRKKKNEVADRVKMSKGKPESSDIEEGRSIKEKLQLTEPKLAKLEDEFDELIHQIPNIPDKNAPIGKTDEENPEIRKWGEPTKFDFEPKDHVELGKELGIIDFESGAKVSGSQFYYLSGDAVRLELALLQFGIEKLSAKGYIPYITPDLAKSEYYLGTGYQPKGEEAQIYEIDGEDLGLIATAEVTMAGLHSNEVLREKDLPLKYAAISHCFRKEAGAYGKYSKGLYRVHQFTKLEMFIYCTPEKSEEMHQELLSIEEELVQELGIPYRVVEMCTGDLGAMASRKYDLEAWMPGRDDYGEITSTSNTTDYQARNMNVKYDAGGRNEYAHLLNGTALVMSRIPIAILENFQQKDGSVRIPTVLQKWMGKDVIKQDEK